MTAYDDIQTAKGAVDQLKEGANAINEWAEKATELAEAGKELTKIQGVLQGVKIFGKLGAGFAMAGIGLDLALFAFGSGAPDPNEMILNAISALDNKVDAMWNAMDQQFDRIHKSLNESTAKNNVQVEMKYFSALNVIIAAYRKSPKIGIQDLLDDRYDPADIYAHFDGIYNAVIKNNSKDNLLMAQYEFTCGEASTIINTGKNLLAVALLAPMAYALTSALRHKKDPTFSLATPDYVDELFGERINAISDKINEYTKKCWDEAETNVKKKMERDIFPNLEVPGDRGMHTTFRESSKELCEVLKKQWPMFDWVVAVGRWDLQDESPKNPVLGQKIMRLFWPNQRIKNCNVYIVVAWIVDGDGVRYEKDIYDWNSDYLQRTTRTVIKTKPSVAWSCSWTDPTRVWVYSYHLEWLTDSQIKQLKQQDAIAYYNRWNGRGVAKESFDQFLEKYGRNKFTDGGGSGLFFG